jgi:hypothetical protein
MVTFLLLDVQTGWVLAQLFLRWLYDVLPLGSLLGFFLLYRGWLVYTSSDVRGGVRGLRNGVLAILRRLWNLLNLCLFLEANLGWIFVGIVSSITLESLSIS